MSQGDLMEQMDSHLRAWQDSGVEWLPQAGGPLHIPLAVTSPPDQVAQTATTIRANVPNAGQIGPGGAGLAASINPPARSQSADLAAPKFPQTTQPDPGALFPREQMAPPPQRSAEGPPIFELPVLEDYQRDRALKDLAYKVSQCKKCPDLVRTRTRTVFGTGPINPQLCVIGEAPGFNEDQQGEPFVGPAGEMLTRMLAACGFDRQEIYICNILRCRPPENRPPLPDEAANCRPFLVQTLELVRPKHICLMGGSATKYLLGRDEFIGQLRGRELDWRGIPVTATYHPSYLLRSPAKKHDAWADLQQMLLRMGRTLPGK
jgi:DNA polymerase